MNLSGIESSAIFGVIWWVIASFTVLCAVLVIHLRDLVKAAMALIGAFLGIAGFFVMLNAEFLAVVQVLIYAGGVSILIIFAILTIKDVQHSSTFNRLRLPALLITGALLWIVIFAILDAPWSLLADVSVPRDVEIMAAAIYNDSSPVLGTLLFQEFIIPLEAAGLVLVAALLGAIALVSRGSK